MKNKEEKSIIKVLKAKGNLDNEKRLILLVVV